MFFPFFNSRDHFYQYGEIRSITHIARQQCAFIQFTQRVAAELAAERTFNKLILGGRRMNIKWGRSQGRQGNPMNTTTPPENEVLEPVPGLPGTLPLPPQDLHDNFFNLGQTEIAPLPPPPPPFLPPPMLMPPPLPRPPSGIRPPGPPPPPFFFPPHMRLPPGLRPPIFTPQPPPLCPPGTAPPLPPDPASLAPPGTLPIHYPSQDPSRLGTAQKQTAE